MKIAGADKKIETLSIDDARELVAGKKESEIIILDVRQPEEYRSGHLPGAIFMPLPDLIDKAGELDSSKSVLAYCRSGSRSRAAAAFLLSEGFSKVYSLEGGIIAWKGQVATGNYDEGLFLLKGRETAEELISLALALEEGSRIFYENVAQLTSDSEAKKILCAIADAEARHKTNILQAYRVVTGDKVGEDIWAEESLKGVMESGIKIEDAVNFLAQKGNILIDILEVSMQLETNALDLYIKISRGIENTDAKKIFMILIDEEKHHLSRLGKLLGERIT